MRINKKFGQPIEIIWKDACEVQGWKSFDEALQIPSEAICKTRAFFLGQTKEYISVAHTIGLDISNDVCGILHIPCSWIIKIK